MRLDEVIKRINDKIIELEKQKLGLTGKDKAKISR